MRNYYLSLLLLAMSSVALLTACESDVYNPDNTKVENTKDLIAPSDFDWKMTSSTKCTITSPVTTTVSVYTDAACTNKSLLIENLLLTANEAKELTLEVPSYQSNIYVQYSTADGKKVLEGKINATTRNKDEDIILILPGDVIMAGDNVFDYFYYPSKEGQGTLMFEDLYPALGDYDFNDFVIGYNVATFMSRGAGNYDGFTMTFKIRAMGGSLPYRPALRLKGFPMSALTNADIAFESTRDGISMELALGRSGNQDVIFIINGTEKLRNNGFFNTDPEKDIDTDLPIITCKVRKNNFNDKVSGGQYSYLAQSLPKYFDFFLQNTSTKDEIHFKGFNPTDMSDMDPNTEFIHDGRKLVWAIAVPEEIAYPKEKVDILDVFKGHFQSWVSSGGGKQHADWYKKPVKEEGLFKFE